MEEREKQEYLDLLERETSVDSVDSYRAWSRRCDALLEIMREECRGRSRMTTFTGEINSLACRIAILLGVRNRLCRRFFAHVGAGLDEPSTSSSVPSSSASASASTSASTSRGFSWAEIDTAFDRRVLTGVVINQDHIEPRRFLEEARDTVLGHVRDNLERHGCLKVNTLFNGEFVITSGETAVKSIATSNYMLLPTSDLLEWYDRRVMDVTLTALEEFQERDSGWALSRIANLMVNINKCNPMCAGCWMEIPSWIKHTRSVVDVKRMDNACFARSIVAALYPVSKNPARWYEYPPYSTILNFDGIEFPMALRCITKFERLNDISVNVFTVREGEVRTNRKRKNVRKEVIVPLRLTDNKRDCHVNLLYLKDERPGVNVGHYAWIRNLSRLVSSQLSSNNSMKHICDRCLHYFGTTERLIAHGVDCGKMNDCAILLPSDDEKFLFFQNQIRKERLSFVVYADLECVLEKRDEADHQATLNATHIYQHHRPFSVGYYLCCSYNQNLSMYRSRRGEDCVSWFVNELNDIAHRVRTILTRNVIMAELTLEERSEFFNATRCHICGRLFQQDDYRVRDHCHLTGRYRGPAHLSCNLNYKDSFVIPVFFHNLSGYDAHFIIKDIANSFEGRVDLLPINKETYISFTKNVKEEKHDCWGNRVKLRFVDSFRFLGTSLEKLASYLDKSRLRITRSEFWDISEEDFDLLTRKGVFPYEYVDSVDKLSETELPPRVLFFSSLSGDVASESDYEHALNVWRCFRVNNLGEYSDLYLKTDVLLLADIFENFRNNCVDSYGLDPAHYYTLPGYTWDAMLKHTGVRFELLTDIDMLLFVERGIRGGLSQCSHRYARANNLYMSSYDWSEPSTYLMYFDVNNLYGWAMCEPLPYADFRWLDDPESFNVMSVTSDSSIGYILEVDLAYPRELHDAHADLPFCPTREKPPEKRYEKLLATLYDKSRYVVHYRNLQQCVQYGLRVTKIYRVLQFAQSRWLSSYIELNTLFRTLANNEFERNMYKLMNNAVFGKTMENVREHVDVRLVTRWDGVYGAEAMIAKPNFHSRSVFSEDLMAVELRRLEVKYNKPIYVGMCILEISKMLVYDFHYNYMVPLYRDRCKLMYTDTDSLIYHLQCNDAYENIMRDIARFDTSDYPEGNVYGMPRANKKIPGLMKDENNGAIMTEFVGLRAKMYALKVIGKDDTKRIKGVKRNVVARMITFDDYKRCLFNLTEQSRRQSCLRSKLHEVYTVSELKLTLSPYDDKRCVEPDSFDTLPWGHYGISVRENGGGSRKE